MFDLLEWLLQLFGLRQAPENRSYELDEGMQLALQELAAQEQRPAEEVHADLLATALAQQHTYHEHWQRWQSLTPREQQVTALCCLGYTNRQIAARLFVSVETIKTHMHNILVKFDLHGKAELRLVLADWDFSAWEDA